MGLKIRDKIKVETKLKTKTNAYSFVFNPIKQMSKSTAAFIYLLSFTHFKLTLLLKPEIVQNFQRKGILLRPI